MKINKQDLLDALGVVKPGLASKEVIEQSTSFAFIGDRVITYNDEISISHPVEGINFEGAVKAEEIYTLVSKLQRSELQVTVSDSELLVKAGKVKAGLRFESEINLPILEVPKKFKKIKDPTLFIEGLKMAMNTCGTDMSDPKLTCVSVRKDGRMYASDGFRLFKYNGESLPVDDFMIPAWNVRELVKIHPTEIKIDKSWAHFKNDQDTVFSCRLFDDTYLPEDKMEEVLQVKSKSHLNFPDTISDMIDRVKPFSKREHTLDEKVYVVIADNKIKLKASTETGSWVEEKTTVQYDKNFSFVITPSLFESILAITKECRLDTKAHKACFESERWIYIVMLRQGE